MSTSAHVLVLVLVVAVIMFIAWLVARRQLRSKYALLWLAVAVVLVPFAIVPSLLNDVAHWLGFAYAPALLFLLAIGFLFAVAVHLSWELSRVEARVRRLAETVAIDQARRQRLPGASLAATADDRSST
jgi:hypothetical protein